MTQTPTGPAADGTGQLDEAYQRLHATGPEFDGWLSNHGPMGAEAIVRHGHAAELGPWLDGYITRLEEFPRGLGPIGGGWRDALGDPRRIADWTGYFRAELAGQPWREVLGTLWPRLLPGVVAALPAPGTPEETRATLTALVDAATLSYLRYGHGNPVMLVHAATAPNAVLRVLPVLDPALWAPSLTAAWAASSALTAIYAPAGAAPEAPRTPGGRPSGLAGVDEAASMFARAVEHGDAHVVKFADTALDVFGRTGNPDALAAAHQAADLIDR
jgi:hypothetical protein